MYSEGGDQQDESATQFGENGEILTDCLSVSDEINPHHPNNRVHAYEWLEAILRCAARYGTEKFKAKRGGRRKGGSAEAPTLRLSDCFQAMLSDNLLRYSCTHTTMTPEGWYTYNLVLKIMNFALKMMSLY